MFIVDKDLKKLIDQNVLQITVDNENPPFNPSEQIGASSIDLRLSRFFRKYKPGENTVDLAQEEETEIIKLPLDGEIVIKQGPAIKRGNHIQILKLSGSSSLCLKALAYLKSQFQETSFIADFRFHAPAFASSESHKMSRQSRYSAELLRKKNATMPMYSIATRHTGMVASSRCTGFGGTS